MVSKVLEACTGWLFAAILVLAPFLYGGTTDRAIQQLNWLLAAGCLAWVLLLLSERRLPRVSLPISVASVVLLVQGWIMAVNASGIFDPDFVEYAASTKPHGWLPSAVDGIGAHGDMWRLTVLLPALAAMTDLCRRTRWVTRFVMVMAATGAALAAFGIWQKAAFNPMKIWPVEQAPSTAFATYWYHGNAAALMNIAWPLALTGAIWTFVRGGAHISRAFWILGWALLMVGLAMNGSKAGHALAGMMLLLILLLAGVRVRTLIANYGWQQLLVAGAAVVIAVAWILSLDEVTMAIRRWQEFLAKEGWDSRVTVGGQCLEMFQRQPVFGHGPGSFMASFQLWLAEQGKSLRPIWKYAHNDYLQALVEWGVVGFAAWAMIWGSGLIGAGRALWQLIKPAVMAFRKKSRRSRERWRRSIEAMRHVHLVGGSIAFIGLMTHAAMDFPLQIYSVQLYGLCLVAMLSARDGAAAEMLKS